MAKKSLVDWESLELQYRAGVRSLKDIGGEFGVSDAGIIKKARKEGWERDLSARIQAKAEAKVSASIVSKEVSDGKKANEKLVVEANAQAIATIRLAHRTDIRRYRDLCQSMVLQLEAETGEPGLFAELGEILARPDDKGQDRLADAYKKAISLPQRIDGVKKLAETLKVLIGLEREAYNIASVSDPESESKNLTPKNPTQAAREIAFALALGLRAAKK